MADENKTTRAYTMRVDGDAGALFETHLAVNAGARAFGDLVLTLRGGLPASAVSSAPEARDGMVMLALGWLAVEAPADAVPEGLILATADMPAGDRRSLLEARLLEILSADGVAGPDAVAWVEACRPSLGATIRPDAVWVDRRAVFDREAVRFGWTSSDAEAFILKDLLGPAAKYLAIDGEGGGDYVIKAGGWLS